MPWVRRLAFLSVGLGLVLVGAALLSVNAQARQPGDNNEGLALFSEMMPAFTSPRCMNCHGGVDPVSGANHEPGPVQDSTRLSNGDMGFDEQKVCQECHTAGTANWRTAPLDMGFVGKDALTLCRQIRRTMAPDFLIGHLSNDDLIGVAFVGQGGIGEDSPFATIEPDPPPMSRDELVAAAQKWVDVGHAQCSGTTWSGVITQRETAQNHQDREPGTLLVKDSASDLTTTIVVTQSTAIANVTFTSHDFTDAPPNRPCWVIHYSTMADGRGDAGLQIIGDTDAGGMFLSWYVPAYTGTSKTEQRTVPPACKTMLNEVPFSYPRANAGVQPTVDPQDPNHVAGQSVTDNPVTKTTVTIKWDLTRDP